MGKLRQAYRRTQQACYGDDGTVTELCRVRNMLRTVGGSRSGRVVEEADFNYWGEAGARPGRGVTRGGCMAGRSRSMPRRAAQR